MTKDKTSLSKPADESIRCPLLFAEEYDAFLKQLGQRPPARDKPETDRARWWEVAFAVAFASAVEWQFDLLGLRTFIVRERRKWGYKT